MIKTERCTMIRFNNEHRDFYHTLVSNERVRKYLGGIPSEDHIEKSIDKFIHDSSGAFWVVRENATNHYIGLISIDHSEAFDKYELSYEFLSDWWGKGYASETVYHALNYAFDEMNVHELIAVTQTRNTSSRRLLEKLGLTRQLTKLMFGEEQSVYSLVK